MTDMSMLSAQCDELRELAARYDELQAGAVKAVTMPSNMGPILRDAADTIWELRDSVHRERAEADRLRERITTQKQTIQAYRDESREWREVADHVQAENAKLRELLLDVADVLEEHTKLLELAERLRSAASDGTDNAHDVFAENAKLRKLLLDVWNNAMQFDGFWDYVHDDGKIYNEDELPHYQERMRELGIEAE